MGKIKKERESPLQWSIMWSIIMVLIGLVLTLLGQILNVNNIVSGIILRFFGPTILSIFSVSLVYDTLVADKHFEEFKKILKEEIEDLDSIQGKSIRLGITDILTTRGEYNSKYPLINIIEEAPENNEIVGIGKGLFYFLGNKEILQKGLEKGLTFRLALVDPKKITPLFEKVTSLFKEDIEAQLNVIEDIFKWILNNKPKGTIEIRYRGVEFPDSVLIFTSKDGTKKIVWDLSFGRSSEQKREIILDTNYPLGKDLMERYMTIYDKATLQIKYSNGKITDNKLDLQLN